MKTTKWLAVLTMVSGMVAATDVCGAPGDGRAARQGGPGGGAGGGQAGGGQRQKDPARLFGKIDADGNGSVTLDEFKAGAEKRRQRFAERRGNGAGGGNRPGGGDRTPPSPEDIFAKMDANGDGSLTQDEFTTALANRKGRKGQGAGNMGARGGSRGQGRAAGAPNR